MKFVLLRYCLILIVGFFGAFFITSAGSAVPAFPGLILFQQPDGSTFTGKLKGDEWFHWIEVSNHKIVVKNRETGFYEYGTIKKTGGKEILAPSGIRVNIQDKKMSAVSSGIPQVTPQDMGRLWKTAITEKNNRRRNLKK